LTFLDRFSKNPEISNFAGDELFNADGRADRLTDMTKLIVAFRKFANTPKKITPETRQVDFYRKTSSKHSANSGQTFAIAIIPNPDPVLLHGCSGVPRGGSTPPPEN